MPTSIQLELVETLHDGAITTDRATPFAPRLEMRANEVMEEPERPRFGLWVLRAQNASMRPVHLDAADVVDAGL